MSTLRTNKIALQYSSFKKALNSIYQINNGTKLKDQINTQLFNQN